MSRDSQGSHSLASRSKLVFIYFYNFILFLWRSQRVRQIQIGLCCIICVIGYKEAAQINLLQEADEWLFWV